jgi:hypothetical protein
MDGMPGAKGEAGPPGEVIYAAEGEGTQVVRVNYKKNIYKQFF